MRLILETWRYISSGSTLAQIMACCLCHQAITGINVDLSSMRFFISAAQWYFSHQLLNSFLKLLKSTETRLSKISCKSPRSQWFESGVKTWKLARVGPFTYRRPKFGHQCLPLMMLGGQGHQPTHCWLHNYTGFLQSCFGLIGYQPINHCKNRQFVRCSYSICAV